MADEAGSGDSEIDLEVTKIVPSEGCAPVSLLQAQSGQSGREATSSIGSFGPRSAANTSCCFDRYDFGVGVVARSVID